MPNPIEMPEDLQGYGILIEDFLMDNEMIYVHLSFDFQRYPRHLVVACLDTFGRK